MKGGSRPRGENNWEYDRKVKKNMDEPLNYEKLSKEAREYIDNQHRENRRKPNYKMTCDICPPRSNKHDPKIRGIGGIDTQGLSICDMCYTSNKIKRKGSRKKIDGETVFRPSDFSFEDLYETFISDYHDKASSKSKKNKNPKKSGKTKKDKKKKQTKKRQTKKEKDK